MTTLREAAQQALEALMCVDLQSLVPDYGSGHYSVARLDGPQVKSAITAMEAALAEPTVKESLQVESAFAENATTQQQLEEAPPSDYRRGYWDGFEIGKREGRIEAENALAEEQAEPDSPERRCGGPGCDMTCCQPVQEPVAWRYWKDKFACWEYSDTWLEFPAVPAGTKMYPLYAAPPQRAAEPAQEPVAYSEGRTLHWHEGKGVSDAQLFAAPPRPKPLAEWQINDLMADIDPEDRDSWSFRQGVYAAEKHHGVRK